MSSAPHEQKESPPHAHRLRQRQVHLPAGGAHPRAHRAVRGQALPRVRRQALRRLPRDRACFRALRPTPRFACSRACATTSRSSSPSTPTTSRAPSAARDIGITYDEDVAAPHGRRSGRVGFSSAASVITHFTGQPHAEAFQRRLESMGVTLLPPLPHRRLPVRRRAHRERRGLRQERLHRDDAARSSWSRRPARARGKLATCLSQLYHEHKSRRARGLRQVRDLPGLEPAAQAPGEHRLRGRHRRPRRPQHHRPVPPRGLRRGHGQLQPRRRDVPRAQGHDGAVSLGESPYQSPTDMGVNMVGLCISDDDACQRGGEKRDRASLLPRAAEELRRTGEGEGALAKTRAAHEPGGRRRPTTPPPTRPRSRRRPPRTARLRAMVLPGRRARDRQDLRPHGRRGVASAQRRSSTWPASRRRPTW